MDGMYNDMVNSILGLEDHLIGVIKFVAVLPFSNFSGGGLDAVATVVANVSTSLQSTAITLLIFCFFYEFLKKTVMFEFVNWENVVKILLRFLIAKLVVQNCYAILEAIGIVINGVLAILGNPQNLSTILDDSALSALTLEYMGAGIINKVFLFLKMGLCWLAMFVIRVAILFVVYGRFIEIAIYATIAPIPLATLGGESTSGVAKKFIQSYVGVLLQGVIIVAMCLIYVGVSAAFASGKLGLGSMGDIVQYLICSGVLLFTVAKSGNWAKQIMGA